MIKFNTLLVKSYGSEIITNQEEFEIDYLGIPAYFSIIKKSYIHKEKIIKINKKEIEQQISIIKELKKLDKI